MWLLFGFVLMASASLPDRIIPLCVRQPSTQLRFREHRERYQETFLQATDQSTSPTFSLTAASSSSSHQPIDDGTLSESSNQIATHVNTTRLVESLGGLDLATENDDSGETFAEAQRNPLSHGLDEEGCPAGLDMLDCENCGGPEHTWEINHNDYHCKGVSTSVSHNHNHKQC